MDPWFIHLFRGHIVEMFIEALIKSSFRFANMIFCLSFFMYRSLGCSLVGIDTEIYRSFFALICIDDVLRFTIN